MEVVVVDDGSTDGTREYLEHLDDERVHSIFQEHKGGQHARNRGLSEAQGEYVKFLDDDDWLAEGGIQEEVDVLESTGADLGFGYYKRIDENGTVFCTEEQAVPDDLIAKLFTGARFTIPLNVTYRHVFVKGLRWEPSLPCGQDYAFLLEAALQDPHFVPTNTLTGYKREHNEGSVSLSASQKAHPPLIYTRMLRKAAERLLSFGSLTECRREAICEGLWKWGHAISACSWEEFEKVHSVLQEISYEYQPSRPNHLLNVLDNIAGPKATERLLRIFR